MVKIDAGDVIPVSSFAFAWRITDAKWASLPEEVLRRVRPLSERRSKQVFEMSPLADRQGQPFDPERYHSAANTSLEDVDAEHGASWLRALPVDAGEQVYVCWATAGRSVAVVTDWATFTEVWDDLWYPFDRVCVFDESLAWALLLGPEEQAQFIQRSPTDARHLTGSVKA